MSTVVCVPPKRLPAKLKARTEYVSLYESSARGDVGTVGTSLREHIERSGLCPTATAWDFTTFALAVSAADLVVSRDQSPDGWTRVIQLRVAITDPAPFSAIATKLEEMLRFLTGDFWKLTFIDGGMHAPASTARMTFAADSVCLLSGGADSLVGAIDLTSAGKQPLFVSQIVMGDAATQREFARKLGGQDRHLQWNQNIRLAGDADRSTRARSLVFFAFAALAADALGTDSPIDVFVPENGFISLNVPLNAGRISSLSTRTTHPVFMRQLQSAWNSLGLKGALKRPHARETKGEMFAACSDHALFGQLVGRSTSCGRYKRYGFKHCGRCVPCLVRRAAFLHASIKDPTTYVYKWFGVNAADAGANDVGAIASAILLVEGEGVKALTAGHLSFATPAWRVHYEGVVKRGLAELAVLFRKDGAL